MLTVSQFNINLAAIFKKKIYLKGKEVKSIGDYYSSYLNIHMPQRFYHLP